MESMFENFMSEDELASTTMSPSPGSGGMDAAQLSSILFQCFALIILGYVSGRFSIISEAQSRGLTNFVSYFSLPALIFMSLAKCDLTQIDWYFVASVCIAKVSVFTLVVVITLLVTRPYNLGKAGLYGIFATQSNDFAIGYPIFLSLYEKTHPNYPDYLYVIAPLQLILINPCGLLMMEIHKYRQAVDEDAAASKPAKTTTILGQVLKNSLTNPIIGMTIGGLVWNLVLGPCLPPMLNGLLKSLSDAFTPTSLFLLGLNIVQEAGFISNSSRIVVPCTLTAVKVFIFPIVLRLITQNLIPGSDKHVSTMSSFGFLYGTIPCAPTVVIFSLTYNLSCWVVSYGLIISTIISAPLIFVSANMIRYSDYTPERVEQDLVQTISIISLISIPCAAWTIFMFIFGRKWTSITHRVTFLLVIAQLTVAIGGYISPDCNSENPKVGYFVPIIGIFATRVWTSVLALTFALLQRKSLCYVLKLQNFLSLGAIFICIMLSVTLYLIAPYSPANSKDPYFKFGIYQALPKMILLVVSIIITGSAIILQQRKRAAVEFYEQLEQEPDAQTNGTESSPISSPSCSGTGLPCENKEQDGADDCQNCETVSIEDIMNTSIASRICRDPNCQSKPERRKSCLKYLKGYWGDIRGENIPAEMNWRSLSFQKHIANTPHLALLLILMLSMVVDLAVCISKLFSEKLTGIHVELLSLDIFLVYGQAISTFILFGLDLTSFLDFWRCLLSHVFAPSQSSDATAEGLSEESHHICQQFQTYHQDKCAKDITLFISSGCAELDVFKGRDLVDWLIQSGLAVDRKFARSYATHLLQGHVIKSVCKTAHFLDTSSFYQFLNLPRSIK